MAIAFGIASGVSPEKGLFTAIVAGFLVSALGGSRVHRRKPKGPDPKIPGRAAYRFDGNARAKDALDRAEELL